MWNLLVFAVIGLLAGAAARLMYPGRQTMHILGTLVLGMLGALAGGMLSWTIWPAIDDQAHFGNLIMSLVGAVVVIVVTASVTYARRIGDSK